MLLKLELIRFSVLVCQEAHLELQGGEFAPWEPSMIGRHSRG